MRRFLFVFLLLLSCTARTSAAEPALPPAHPSAPWPGHQRVLVLGDSITQDGRYVSYLEYYLQRFAPDTHSDLISIGLSSETLSGLTEPDHPAPRPCLFDRLDRALELVKPQVVLACYGMNDGIYHPASPERLAAFTHGLSRLIEKVHAIGAQLLLITPPVFDARPISARTVSDTAPEFGYKHPYNNYDDVLAEFAAAEIAQQAPKIRIIDLHQAMRAALTAARVLDPAFTFSPDGVHPNEAGHLLIARTLATGLGLALPEMTAAVELPALAADPRFTLIRDRRALRSEAWLPYIGYTNGKTYHSASVAATERVVARLEAEIEIASAK